MFTGGSAYVASKLALVKFYEMIAAETEDLQVVIIHPGVIDTRMNVKSDIAALGLPYDDIKLPAHFTIWAASKEAAFANGRFLWCNWDVDELKKNPKFYEDPLFLTSGINPFPNF
jgi:NAD(P)-dependent dehydrogenase (short-subunit alcohol dehydrogenase family)